jgi:hypothetical protein
MKLVKVNYIYDYNKPAQVLSKDEIRDVETDISLLPEEITEEKLKNLKEYKKLFISDTIYRVNDIVVDLNNDFILIYIYNPHYEDLPF